MNRLVLLRHGESEWNRLNLFSGWTDVDLSETGREEARQAGRTLKALGYVFDVAFTSQLKRATETLRIVLAEMGQTDVPVHKDWHLNERHYGALQGLNKAETAEQYGAEQVHIWRRSYDVRPPALILEDPRHPRFDTQYADMDSSQLPATESLKDTMDRVIPYWNDAIEPILRTGNKVIISAHGNSLRALVKHLDAISDNDISKLNIPTGIPLIYELDDDANTIKHYYLDTPEIPKQDGKSV
ncbi:MAG: 2,3-diphosphoglycerate-dependent phosphoglycerate mutase [Proteobacteria bacterium]|nr:2,3-diphosphoglycerate-dependent phosphoglycerate mutase [Pseudomonadota bacterium]TDJ70126.1 MAG: 2,3-diphosphoglycerate-dependent phosphoglycerate mutase [Pseudomonadota bacterium]